MKMWVIDDVDAQGQVGMTVMLAKSEREARRMFAAKHNGALRIAEIEACDWVSLAMWDNERGATGYLRRATVA